MFQQNRRNSGNAYDEESQSSNIHYLKWTYDKGGSISELPVIDQHGNAYVSVDEGKIINSTPKVNWTGKQLTQILDYRPVLSTSGKIFCHTWRSC